MLEGISGGRSASVGAYVVAIAGYALIAATVGMILRAIPLIVLALIATIIAVAITGLVQSALTGIYAAALYRFATTGEGTQGFDANAMKLAFAPK